MIIIINSNKHNKNNIYIHIYIALLFLIAMFDYRRVNSLVSSSKNQQNYGVVAKTTTAEVEDGIPPKMMIYCWKVMESNPLLFLGTIAGIDGYR